MDGQVVFDCEGPITLNDNALELCQSFLPDGELFFTQVSRYDDYLADLVKKPGYKAGDTLKLILPFLKIFGCSNRSAQDLSRENLSLQAEAAEMLDYVSGRASVFIISTSYEPYIRALCDSTGFPFEQTFCTQVDFDKHPIAREDERQLRSWREEIVSLPLIELPASANRIEDLDKGSRKSVSRLDEIFWQEIPRTGIQPVLDEVDPVGGEGKARALRKSLERTGFGLDRVMYVGDSITDVQAFDLVRKGGGLTISFNGNRYALQAAEVACIGETAFVLSLLADIFLKQGRAKVIESIDGRDLSDISVAGIDHKLLPEFKLRYQKKLPMIKLVRVDNRQSLIKESEQARAEARGLAGQLG